MGWVDTSKGDSFVVATGLGFQQMYKASDNISPGAYFDFALTIMAAGAGSVSFYIQDDLQEELTFSEAGDYEQELEVSIPSDYTGDVGISWDFTSHEGLEFELRIYNYTPPPVSDILISEEFTPYYNESWKHNFFPEINTGAVVPSEYLRNYVDIIDGSLRGTLMNYNHGDDIYRDMDLPIPPTSPEDLNIFMSYWIPEGYSNLFKIAFISTESNSLLRCDLEHLQEVLDSGTVQTLEDLFNGDFWWVRESNGGLNDFSGTDIVDGIKIFYLFRAW